MVFLGPSTRARPRAFGLRFCESRSPGAEPGRTTAIGTTSLRAGDFVVNGRVDYTDFRELVAWWGRCGVKRRSAQIFTELRCSNRCETRSQG